MSPKKWPEAQKTGQISPKGTKIPKEDSLSAGKIVPQAPNIFGLKRCSYDTSPKCWIFFRDIYMHFRSH